jgi:hypothetical protein
MQIDNTGTVNLKIDVNTTAAPPTCWSLNGCNQTLSFVAGGYTPITNTAAGTFTMAAAMTPAETAYKLWLFANTTGCTVVASTQKTLTIWGAQV